MMGDSTSRAAGALLEAAYGGRLTHLPNHLAPKTEAEAYAIQDLCIRGQQIGGWKVAPAAQGQVPQCAPIVETRVLENGTPLPSDLRAPEIEVEVAFRFSRDIETKRTPVTREDILSAIGSTHIAFEVLDSRFVDRRQISPLAALADCQSTSVVIVGDGIYGYASVDSEILCPRLTIDGREYEGSQALPSSEALLDALVWLAEHATSRGVPLRFDQVVITGARIGPIPISRGCRLDGVLPGIGTVHSRF